MDKNEEVVIECGGFEIEEDHPPFMHVYMQPSEEDIEWLRADFNRRIT